MEVSINDCLFVFSGAIISNVDNKFPLCISDPFFIRQQIITLRDEGLIRFGDNGWVWDTEELEGVHDSVLGNVVVMLSEKMKQLPSLTQEVLKVGRSKTILLLLSLLRFLSNDWY